MERDGGGEGLRKLHSTVDRRKGGRGHRLELAYCLAMLSKCSRGRKREQETHSHDTRSFTEEGAKKKKNVNWDQ